MNFVYIKALFPTLHTSTEEKIILSNRYGS